MYKILINFTHTHTLVLLELASRCWTEKLILFDLRLYQRKWHYDHLYGAFKFLQFHVKKYDFFYNLKVEFDWHAH